MNAPLKLLSRLLRKEDQDEILGDLEEGYRQRAKRRGRRAADRWLWRQVITLPAKLTAYRISETRQAPRGSSERNRRAAVGDVFRDLRFGFRGLRRRPVFAATAILTLAVGVGMTTTMFTLVDAVLLRPLYGSHTRGMVYLELEAKERDVTTSPTPELLRLIGNHASSFSRVEAYAIQNQSVSVAGEPFRVRGAQASTGFFSFLGVRAELGRGFRPGDGSPDGTPVVVLSHTFWKERFGERDDVLGESLVIEGVAHEIVGVLPREFRVDTRGEAMFWVPEGNGGTFFQDGVPLEGALAQLADGVTLEVARAELDAMIRNNPLTRRGNLEWAARVRTPADFVDPSLKQAILLLQAGAILVLLVACGNLANLLLVQGEARARELAVRASLGAGRGRLIRQLLMECVVLGLVGGVGGIVLAQWALDALPLFLPPGYAGIAMDPMILLFSGTVAMVGILAAGLLPAVNGSRRNLAQMIKGRPGRRLGLGGILSVRQLLVSAEVAMALVLMISSGLLLKSFAGLASRDVGFQKEDLLTLRLELPPEEYSGEESRRTFLHQLRDELNARLPHELADATVATGLVEGLSASMAPLTPEGSTEAENQPGLLLVWGISPNYFDVVGVPLDQGRAFQDTDGPESEPVVIINREVAHRHFPDGDAVGRRIRLDQDWFRVVGVAGSVNLPSLAQSVFGKQQLYFPLSQRPTSDPSILVRVRADASTVVDRMKEAVWAVNPTLPVQDLNRVEDALAESLNQERSNAILMVVFGITALALGAVGIYGVVAYSVGRQLREIGIRVSLGATKGREVGRVLRRGMGPVVVGLGLGGVCMAGLASQLSGLLYRVSTRDPQVLALGVILVATVALLSTWLPARRAAGSAPVQALKGE